MMRATDSVVLIIMVYKPNEVRDGSLCASFEINQFTMHKKPQFDPTEGIIG